MTFLDLSNNNFDAQIFPEYWNFTKLVRLYVNNNLFGGKIGDGLNKANSLNFLDVSNNMVSGQIPRCIGRLVKSLVSSNVESNNVTMNVIRHNKLHRSLFSFNSLLLIVCMSNKPEHSVFCIHEQKPTPLKCLMTQSL